MKNFVFILFMSIMIISCNNHRDDKDTTSEKVWVYIEVSYITKNDTTADYIYGRIHQSDLDKIKSQSNSESLFELSDGRYLDDNKIVHNFSDRKESGTFFYRIKNVVYLEIQDYDPLKVLSDTITD